MPDPMDELENFTSPGLTMDPLPAAEVRRRGTRLRRRNTALAAAGGVLAVAVIAAPFAADERSSELLGAAAGEARAAGVVAADDPRGLPAGSRSPDTGRHDVDLRVPGHRRLQGVGLGTHRRRGRASGDVHRVRGRVHALPGALPDGPRRRAGAPEPSDEGAGLCRRRPTARTARLSCSRPASTARCWSTPTTTATAATSTRSSWSQVGNAIFQATKYSIGVPAQDTADQVAQESAAVVDAMCVFSAAGCGSASNAVDPTPDESTVVTAVPADFPLLDGLPTTNATNDFGRYGPGQDEALRTIRGCGVKMLDTPPPADWLTRRLEQSRRGARATDRRLRLRPPRPRPTSMRSTI